MNNISLIKLSQIHNTVSNLKTLTNNYGTRKITNISLSNDFEINTNNLIIVFMYNGSTITTIPYTTDIIHFKLFYSNSTGINDTFKNMLDQQISYTTNLNTIIKNINATTTTNCDADINLAHRLGGTIKLSTIDYITASVNLTINFSDIFYQLYNINSVSSLLSITQQQGS